MKGPHMSVLCAFLMFCFRPCAGKASAWTALSLTARRACQWQLTNILPLRAWIFLWLAHVFMSVHTPHTHILMLQKTLPTYSTAHALSYITVMMCVLLLRLPLCCHRRHSSWCLQAVKTVFLTLSLDPAWPPTDLQASSL